MNLAVFLRSTNLFKGADTEILSLLAERLVRVTIPAGEVLIREGEPGDSLYLLQAGKLNVFLKGQAGDEILVASLLPGDSVGEIGLLTGAIRSATVRTAESSQLWQLTRHAFEQISAADPSLRSAVESAMLNQLQRAQLRAVIYDKPLFKRLDTSVVSAFEQSLDMILIAGGETLFCAGEASDAFYVVVNGCLRVVPATAPEEPNSKSLFKDVGSGQIVGELGIISGEPRTATVVAVRETLLGRLNAKAFYHLLQKHPREMLHLTSTRIAADYKDKLVTTEESQHSLRTFALFAVGTDVPLADFAQLLTQTLSRYGEAQQIDEAFVNRALGQSDIAHAPPASVADRRLAIWFGEHEAQYDYLVYTSNEDISEAINWAETQDRAAGLRTQPHRWSERCAQQADHILYVAWADNPARAVSAPSALKVRRSLVLLHPPECRIPTETERWLAAVNPDGHYHLHWSAADDSIDEALAGDDLRRLARLLIGRGIGLVLSGGGARGYAHVGAIRALEEAGIPIDRVGGTSMGAIVAGLSAIGHDADSMTAVLADHLSDRSHLVDYTLPLTSLLRGQKLEGVVRTLFGAMDIPDTWRPFFCISTDITHAAEVVHQAGPLWRSVRASMSLPGVFPPQVAGDRLLVDGCLMNNFPANIMHDAFGCTRVIGVNACGEGDLYGKNQYGNSLSGWEILNSKINPFAKPIRAPGMLETLIRLTDLNTVDRSQQQRQMTDLYIRPPVETYTAFDFEKHKEIIDIGYGAAQVAIREWLAKEQHDAIF